MTCSTPLLCGRSRRGRGRTHLHLIGWCWLPMLNKKLPGQILVLKKFFLFTGSFPRVFFCSGLISLEYMVFDTRRLTLFIITSSFYPFHHPWFWFDHSIKSWPHEIPEFCLVPFFVDSLNHLAEHIDLVWIPFELVFHYSSQKNYEVDVRNTRWFKEI